MAMRSISLPPRLHPTSLIEVEANLEKLNTLQQQSLSISSLQARLVGLAELYISFTDLIQTPSTKQSLFSYGYDHGRIIQEALDASVALINTCSVARDLVSSLKDHVRELQSALRRSSGVESETAVYVAHRKKSKKEVAECIKELKQTESTSNDHHEFDQSDFYLALIVRLFRQVVSVSIRTFQSLLLLLSVPSSESGARWSLIKRLVTKQASTSTRGEVLGEVASVDVAIRSMQSGKEGGVDMEEAWRRLRVLDCGSHKVEGALDLVFRSLVQNRVSLLNILTHSKLNK